MRHQPYSEVAVSITEFKKNPTAAVASGEGLPIAILKRKTPVFYCIPAQLYEAMLDQLDDQALAAIVQERLLEPSIRVNLDDL